MGEGEIVSVLTAIRKQKNPDGLDGHEERLVIQEESKQYPPKKKFTGGESHHYKKERNSISREDRIRVVKELLKSNCDYYNQNCRPQHCLACGKDEVAIRETIEKLYEHTSVIRKRCRFFC